MTYLVLLFRTLNNLKPNQEPWCHGTKYPEFPPYNCNFLFLSEKQKQKKVVLPSTNHKEDSISLNFFENNNIKKTWEFYLRLGSFVRYLTSLNMKQSYKTLNIAKQIMLDLSVKPTPKYLPMTNFFFHTQMTMRTHLLNC